MAGLIIAGRDLLVFLVLAALLLSLGGALFVGWPILLALLHDGRTYLAVAVTIFALALLWMRRREQPPAAPAGVNEEVSVPSAYCDQCGSERPDLICPMCGAIAQDKMA